MVGSPTAYMVDSPRTNLVLMCYEKLNNNNRTLIVGPSFSGKTHLILKMLSRIPNRDFYKLTNSPPEEYINQNQGHWLGALNEYEEAIIVFFDFLTSSNSQYKDQFLIKGRHNNLDLYYLLQAFFDLSKRTVRNNSKKSFRSMKH